MLSARRLCGPSLVRCLKPRYLTIPAGAVHVDEATLSPEEFRAKHQIKVTGINISDPKYDPVASFDTSPFNKSVLKILDQLGFLSPTSTQAQSWPVAADGRDVISVAKTGSGKTLAFLTPAISKLVSSKTNRGKDPKVLVLAPTRELCLQIHKEAANFERIGIRSVACYGGASRSPQINQIRKGVDVIIATPGRCNDFLESGSVNFSQIDYVVLDEADRMLDMGFEPQIREILNDVPKTKQMLLFTATWPKEVVRLAESYVNSNAVYINIGDDGLNANKAITQNFIMLEKPRGREKMQELVDLLQRLRTKPDDPKSIPKMILFCGRKSDCDYMEDDLKSEGYSCAALHGDKSQTSRDSIMDMFRRGRTRILIATDVASRGLDVRDVEVVVNYDFPPSGVEDYIHRIGRTARGERSGASYTFFTNSDETHAGDLFDILKKSGQEIPEELAQIVDRKRRPLPKKSKYGTRDSPSAGRYGIQRDRDNFRDTGFPRGGGFERRERSPPRRGGGDYDEDMEDYGSRGRRGMPESDRRGRGSAPSSRGSRNRFDDGDADDMFEERKSLREWR